MPREQVASLVRRFTAKPWRARCSRTSASEIGSLSTSTPSQSNTTSAGHLGGAAIAARMSRSARCSVSNASRLRACSAAIVAPGGLDDLAEPRHRAHRPAEIVTPRGDRAEHRRAEQHGFGRLGADDPPSADVGDDLAHQRAPRRAAARDQRVEREAARLQRAAPPGRAPAQGRTGGDIKRLQTRLVLVADRAPAPRRVRAASAKGDRLPRKSGRTCRSCAKLRSLRQARRSARGCRAQAPRNRTPGPKAGCDAFTSRSMAAPNALCPPSLSHWPGASARQ